MKKVLIICLIIVFLILLSIGILIGRISSVGSYAISKITGYEVRISKIDFTYADGIITCSLNDLIVKGNIEGYVKKWILSATIKEGFRLKNVVFSDFDLKISDLKGKTRFVPLFTEFLVIKNGKAAFSSHTFIIREIRINNFKPGATFTFEAGVENDYWFKTFKASGEGIYKSGVPDLKGQINVTQLNLNKLSDNLKGRANINGPFTYTKKEFSLNGPFEIFNYEERDKTFKTPLSVDKASGNVLVAYAGTVTGINISQVQFKGTPLTLDLKFEKDNLARLELGSGFLDLQIIKQYITLDQLTKTPVDIRDYLHEGKVKIKKFVITKGNIVNADLEFKDGEVSYKDQRFNNVEGSITFDDKILNLSNFKGWFKTSMFRNVSGVIPFTGNKTINIKGDYVFNLKDVPSLLDLGELNFRKGETDGTIELEGNEKKGYTLRGAGKLDNAAAIWKNVAVNAKGSYTFTNDEIAFDPLTLGKGSTNITIRGKWHKKFMDFKIKGDLDVLHAKPFLVALPFSMEGTTDLDLSLQQENNRTKLSGDIVMDNLSFEVPGIVKKKSGIKNKASFVCTKEDDTIYIEELQYSLDVINLKLRGDIKDDSTINFDAAMDIPGIERIAPLFFLDSETARGELELNTIVRGLKFPVIKLPYINGYVKVRNGILKLPQMYKPFEDINLTSTFQGDNFDIDVNNLKFGKNILNTGRLHVEGLEFPRFSLSVNMDNIEQDDSPPAGSFEIPVVYKNSIISNASGDISLRAKRMKMGNDIGRNLDIRGTFSDRKLNISELKMDTNEGNVDSNGSIDFSAPLPHIHANVKLNNIAGGLFLESLGGKSQVIDGSVNIYGHIDSSGKNMKELTGNTSGDLAVYSQNGLIKRWNLLSKIFGLLNVYDIFRGKSDLSKEGLPYTRMGATFLINKGIFNTKDFLIDSPSMLITGNGNLDMKKSEIDAAVTVSPLVTVDKTIYKIPILGNILEKKGKGFLNVVYNVKGQLDNPDINVSFTNSVGYETIEFLKNILVLPKGMFK